MALWTSATGSVACASLRMAVRRSSPNSLATLLHLVLEQRDLLFFVRQQVLEVGDRRLQLLLLVAIARQVHARDLGERHLADALSLNLAELEALDQLLARGGAVLGGLEDLDDLVGVDGADDQAVDDVQALPGARQVVFRRADGGR